MRIGAITGVLGITQSGRMVTSGQILEAYAGAVLSGTVVSSGGLLLNGGDSFVATVLQAIVGSGGTLVNVGGTVTGAVFSRGVTYAVQSARLSGFEVSSGLTLSARSGGVLVNTVVNAGGAEYVGQGGITSNAVPGSGAMAFISADGAIYGGRVGSGASVVLQGALRSGLTMAGGALTVSAGAGVGAGQTVTMAGSGNAITVATDTAFNATIAEFSQGDQIDLLGLTFVLGRTTLAWVQGAGSGDLTIRNTASATGRSQTLHLAGTFATSNFVVANDGSIGTVVTFRA